MKNVFLRISQIQNAPNLPYYKDSRILKVVISPSEQCQYANLSGLETLYTDKCFNLRYNENNSVLKLILTETKPNNFDIAYTIVPLEKIQENSLIKETRMMQTIVSGIISPLITFDLQISSEHTGPSNLPPTNLYPTLKNIDSSNCSQKPFIPNDLNFNAIIINNQIQTQLSDNFFVQNNESSSYSSDYDDSEEEDMIINSRIYFSDEAIELLKSSQTYNKFQITKSISKYHKDLTNNSPVSNTKVNQPTPPKNENNPIPFIPPEENDAPFLLPKSLSSEKTQKQKQDVSNPQLNQNHPYNASSNDNNQFIHQAQTNQQFQNQSPNYHQNNYQYYPQNQHYQKH